MDQNQKIWIDSLRKKLVKDDSKKDQKQLKNTQTTAMQLIKEKVSVFFSLFVLLIELYQLELKE